MARMRTNAVARSARARAATATILVLLLVAALPVHGAEVEASSGVVAYRPVPGAVESEAFRVRVDGVEVFVEAYKDVHIARFGMDRPVQVAVETVEPFTGFRLEPERLGLEPTRAEQRVVFALDEPAKAVFQPLGGQDLWHTLGGDRVLRTARVPASTRGRFQPEGPRLFLFADSVEVDPPVPGAPGVLDVRDFGADPSGSVKSTAAIQGAIDASSSAGGGVVLFPPGAYLTGTFRIRDHVTVYLADGALIQGTNDPDDYPTDPGHREGTSDYGEFLSFSRLVHIDGATGVRIAGRGVIDGDGVRLRGGRWYADAQRLSNLIRVVGSSDVVIEDVVLRDSATWNTHILYSDDVRVSNVKIVNDMTNANSDGVVPDGSTNVAVEGLFFYGWDDATVVKATRNSGLVQDVHDIEIRDGVYLVGDGAGMKVGTESNTALFSDIHFVDNDVLLGSKGISLIIRDGAAYEDVHFTGNSIYRVDTLFEQVINLRTGYGPRTPGRMRGIHFTDLAAVDYYPTDNRTWWNQTGLWVFSGYDEDHTVSGLHFHNVTINGHVLTSQADALAHGLITFGPYVDDVTFDD